jgi:transposase-like protein
MGNNGTKRRVYTQEFKIESVDLVAKHEQPVSQIAADLGVNENMPQRWVKSARPYDRIAADAWDNFLTAFSDDSR